MAEITPIHMNSIEGISLVAGIALIYLLIRSIPRLLAGPGSFLRPAELSALLEQSPPPLLIDVRSPAEYASGHLRAAINIPMDHLKAAAASPGDLTDKQRLIVLICQTDNRAAIAAWLLRRGGFEQIRVLAGGVSNWRANDHQPPVVQGPDQ